VGVFVGIWCELERDILGRLHRRLSRYLGIVNTFAKLVRVESHRYANSWFSSDSTPCSVHPDSNSSSCLVIHI